MTWKTAFEIIELLVAVSLIVVVLLQNRGSGLGGAFGQQSGGVFRTRRGLERILYRATIGLAALFVVTSLMSVRAHTASLTPPALNNADLPITLPTAEPGQTPAAGVTPNPAAAPSADGSATPGAAAPNASPPAASPPPAQPTQTP